MLRFHMAIHRRAATVEAGPEILWRGMSVQTLRVDGTGQGATFEVSFDELCERLNAWPRMFLEPDGALVWRGESPEPWQVDGVLNEREGRAWYIELKGMCPRGALEELLRAAGWPSEPVLFQWSEAGVYIDEAEFFRLAVMRGLEAPSS
jgi:hypothetical protein